MRKLRAASLVWQVAFRAFSGTEAEILEWMKLFVEALRLIWASVPLEAGASMTARLRRQLVWNVMLMLGAEYRIPIFPLEKDTPQSGILLRGLCWCLLDMLRVFSSITVICGDTHEMVCGKDFRLDLHPEVATRQSGTLLPARCWCLVEASTQLIMMSYGSTATRATHGLFLLPLPNPVQELTTLQCGTLLVR